MPSSRRSRWLGYYLAALGLLLIAISTLFPDPSGAAFAAGTPIYCVVCGSLGGVDVLLNLLLFVPLGIGLGLVGFSWRRALVLAGLLSFSVELLQLTVIPGRDASLGDILTNTTGGVVGTLLAIHWRELCIPTNQVARRLALSLATALVGIWVLTAWSLGPNLPLSAQWYGQWAPDLGNYSHFSGRVLSLRAGGEPLLPGIAINQERTKDALLSDPSMSFIAVLGERPSSLAPVGSIHDAWQRQVILLGQDRSDLAFRVSMKGSGLRLRVPTVNLKNGLAGQAGDTVAAEGVLRDGVFELTSHIGTVSRTRRLPLSASWGWSLVTPWDSVLGEEVRGLTAIWIAGLLGLLTYWCLLAGGPTPVVAPGTALCLFVVVPAMAHFSPVDWSEWAAAIFGALVGFLAAHSTRTAGGPTVRPGAGG